MVAPLYFNVNVVLRYFELESIGQEAWSDYSTALNQADPIITKEEDEQQNEQLAEYMATTFQETFADPLG